MKTRPPARPFVTVNFAITWDGRVSTRKLTPSDFTSPRDKRRLSEIRAGADAVLVGASTLAADRMTMGLSDPALRAARVARKQSALPLRVIVSNSGRLSAGLRVFEKDFSPIIIFSTAKMPARTRAALAEKADLWLHESATVNLPAMLATLRAGYRVKRLVCEGGPRLFRAMLAENLVDEIHLTLAPRFFGGRAAPTLTGLPGGFLPRSTRCTLREMRVVGGECFLRYRVLAPAGS